MAKRDELVRYLELQDAVLARRAERSLIDFVEQFWHVLEPDRTFMPNWHINLLCEHLQAITDGHNTRLLINLPPRYMKSLIVTVFWPTWEWVRQPTNRWIFASYAEALSAKHSLDRRTVIQSPLYQSRWGHIPLPRAWPIRLGSGFSIYCTNSQTRLRGQGDGARGVFALSHRRPASISSTCCRGQRVCRRGWAFLGGA